MKRFSIAATAVSASLLACAANAATTTILSEDFSDELAGTGGGSVLNFTAFDQFSVTAGTVDLIASGGYGITCLTGGACVDLDGSTGSAGTLLSKTLNLTGGNFYEFSFVLSGNQRGGASDTVTLKFDVDLDYTFAPGDAFQTITYGIDLGGSATVPVTFSLVHTGGDNVGIILDSVTVTETPTTAPVPLPASLPLLGAGLAGLALARRRRR